MNGHVAICRLSSQSPYSQSRSYDFEVPKLERERSDDYEARTWRHKCHTGADGRVFIPPMAFKMALDTAAKMLGRQIPGKGKATFTKFFLSGVLVMEPLVLPLSRDEVACDRIFANADGVRGSGKRVWRLFPRVEEWQGDVAFHVLAPEIGREVFTEHLVQAGAFVGIGRFRPQSGGFYGRFKVDKVDWS